MRSRRPGMSPRSRVAGPPATFHQAPQRLGQVALGHDVVGERLEDLVGIEVGDPLGAVPAREPGRPGERIGGFTHLVGLGRARAGSDRRREPVAPATGPRSRGSGEYAVTGGRPFRPGCGPC